MIDEQKERAKEEDADAIIVTLATAFVESTITNLLDAHDLARFKALVRSEFFDELKRFLQAQIGGTTRDEKDDTGDGLFMDRVMIEATDRACESVFGARSSNSIGPGIGRDYVKTLVEDFEENARKIRKEAIRNEQNVLRARAMEAKAEQEKIEKRLRRKMNKRMNDDVECPRLKEPSRAEVCAFVRRMAKESGVREDGKINEGEFRPTFAKIMQNVKKVSKELLESVGAEYAMLHLGGTKYRAKKFEIPIITTIEEEEEENVTAVATIEKEKEEEEESLKRKVDDNVDRIFKEEELAAAKKRKEIKNEIGDNMKNEQGTNATLIKHEFWEGRLRSNREIANTNVNDFEYIKYIDVIPAFKATYGQNGAGVIIDAKDTGRLGERVCFNVLLQKYRNTKISVHWVNEREESNAFYDIMLSNGESGERTFIEVKATRFRDKNAFEISPWEWDFATKPGVNYEIWRVFGIGDGRDVDIVVVKDPARLIREKKIAQALVI